MPNQKQFPLVSIRFKAIQLLEFIFYVTFMSFFLQIDFSWFSKNSSLVKVVAFLFYQQQQQQQKTVCSIDFNSSFLLFLDN